MADKQEKTNVMRILDAKKLPHECYYFDCAEAPSGGEVGGHAVLGRQLLPTTQGGGEGD